METNEFKEETKTVDSQESKPEEVKANEFKEEAKTTNVQATRLEENGHKKKLTISTKQIFILVLIVAILTFAICMIVKGNKNNKIKENVENLYSMMKESADVLDDIADAIYDNWYDYIYEDEFDSIEEAIWMAQIDEAESIEKVEENDKKISDVLQEVKNSKYKEKNRETYSSMIDAYDSYREYYEFVINVSGSFNSYSAKKEEIKKEVKSYLSKFERNL